MFVLGRLSIPAAVDTASIAARLGLVPALPVWGSPRATLRISRVFDAVHVSLDFPFLYPLVNGFERALVQNLASSSPSWGNWVLTRQMSMVAFIPSTLK